MLQYLTTLKNSLSATGVHNIMKYIHAGCRNKISWQIDISAIIEIGTFKYVIRHQFPILNNDLALSYKIMNYCKYFTNNVIINPADTRH